MRFLPFLIIISIFLSGCYEDEFNSSRDTITEQPEIIIEETGVIGKIITSDAARISEAEFSVNGNTQKVNDAFYYIQLQNAKKKGQFIQLISQGDIMAIGNIYLLENDINYFDIKVFPQAQKETITNTIKISNKTQINTTDSHPIAGQLVNHFSTEDQIILNQLGTSAIDEEGNTLALHPNQLFYYEFEDANGLPLKIDEATPIELDLNSQESTALFYLDWDRDEWILVSDLQDPKVQTSRSGYFLLAEYTNGTYNEGEVVKESDPVSFMNFEWLKDNYSYQSVASSLGKWATVAPSNSSAIYNMKSPCGDQIQEDVIEIQSVNKLDFKIFVESSEAKVISLETQVFDCDGGIETVPALTVQEEGQNFVYLFNEGEIDTWLPVCSADFELSGYNVLTGSNGPLVDWSLSQNDDIDYVSNCEEFENGYAYIKIRDDMKLYEPFEVSTDGNITTLTEMEGRFTFKFKGDSKGIYEEDQLSININDLKFTADQTRGYQHNCNESGCGINDFQVTHFEEDEDGWLRVSFSGEIWMGKIGGPTILADNYEIEGLILTKVK